MYRVILVASAFNITDTDFMNTSNNVKTGGVLGSTRITLLKVQLPSMEQKRLEG